MAVAEVEVVVCFAAIATRVKSWRKSRVEAGVLGIESKLKQKQKNMSPEADAALSSRLILEVVHADHPMKISTDLHEYCSSLHCHLNDLKETWFKSQKNICSENSRLRSPLNRICVLTTSIILHTLSQRSEVIYATCLIMHKRAVAL